MAFLRGFDADDPWSVEREMQHRSTVWTKSDLRRAGWTKTQIEELLTPVSRRPNPHSRKAPIIEFSRADVAAVDRKGRDALLAARRP